MKSLSEREALFVQEFLVDRNGVQAAIRAGYSAKCAKSQASKMLDRAHIAAAIAAGAAKLAKKAELKAADVLLAIKEGIDFDPAQAFDKDGNLLPIPKMPVELRRNLRGFDIEHSKAGELVVKVRWTPRSEHVAQAARVLGMNKDKIELEVRPHAELVAEAMRRARAKVNGGKP